MSAENKKLLQFSIAWFGGVIAGEFNSLSLLGFITVTTVALICSVIYTKFES